MGVVLRVFSRSEMRALKMVGATVLGWSADRQTEYTSRAKVVPRSRWLVITLPCNKKVTAQRKHRPKLIDYIQMPGYCLANISNTRPSFSQFPVVLAVEPVLHVVWQT